MTEAVMPPLEQSQQAATPEGSQGKMAALREKVQNWKPRDALNFLSGAADKLTKRTAEDDAATLAKQTKAAEAALAKQAVELKAIPVPESSSPTMPDTADKNADDTPLAQAAASNRLGESDAHVAHDKWKGHDIAGKIIRGEV